MVCPAGADAEDRERCVGRRDVLRAVGGLAVAAGLAAGGCGAARSQSSGGNGSTVPVISTRGSYADSWTGAARRRSGVALGEYEASGDVPGVDGDCGDRLVVVVHGFQVDESEARRIASDRGQSLREHGVAGDVVPFSWDGDPGSTEFGEARARAAEEGVGLGQFLLDARRACPDLPVHVVGEGLGAKVGLQAIRWLDRSEEWVDLGSGVVESLHLRRAAVDATEPARWSAAIGRRVGRCYNYRDATDERLARLYAPYGDALGTAGLAGEPPGNYLDRNVAGADADATAQIADGIGTTEARDPTGADGTGDGDGEPGVEIVRTFYDANRRRIDWLADTVGDSLVGFHYVEPGHVAPSQRTPAHRRPVVAAFGIDFDGGAVVETTEGAPEDPDLDVYATERAFEYVVTAPTPGVAFDEERQAGEIAVKGRGFAERTVTGGAAYAVDTQRGVVGTWRRTIDSLRYALGV